MFCTNYKNDVVLHFAGINKPLWAFRLNIFHPGTFLVNDFPLDYSYSFSFFVRTITVEEDILYFNQV